MRRFLMALLLLLVSVSGVAAQEHDSSDEVVLYVERGSDRVTSAELLVIDNGIVGARFPLPDELFANGNIQYTNAVAASSDHRYAAVALGDVDATTALPIVIFSPMDGTCCTTVTPPMENIKTYSLGGFSPDGTQLAIAYISEVDAAQFIYTGEIATVDVATGQVVNRVPYEMVSEALGQEPVIFVQLFGWQDDGIRFLQSCWACDGVGEGRYWIWNPETNAITRSTSEYYSIFGDTLAGTGELLYTTFNPAFPSAPGMESRFIYNTVEYYAASEPMTYDQRQNNPTAAPVAYADPSKITDPAHWVLDGDAYAFMGPQQATIVFRDGSVQQVNATANEILLAGTPEGFVTGTQDWRLLHYTYSGGQWTVNELAQLDEFRFPRVIDSADMGEGDLTPLATIPAPEGTSSGGQSASGTTCPGFMPSRLVAGGYGRVPAGNTVNLRTEPSRNGVIAGIIPENATFAVVSGPRCDPAGIAWWEVEYNGVFGWAAEGSGSDYFVEPA